MKKSIAIVLSIMLVLAITFPTAAISSVAVKSIKLESNKIILKVGETASLKVTLTPENTTQKKLTYVTGNKRVATVDANGLITGVHAGEMAITVYTPNNKVFAKCNVVITSTYPLKTGVTIKWWLRSTIAKLSNTGDSDWAKLLIKKTGVKIEFTNPPMGKEQDAFNILLASGDLPDIVSYHWGLATSYPGGAGKALSDGIALQLNDVMAKWAPNLTNALKSNAMWDKQSKTDNGKYWMFPFIRGDATLMTFQGPIIRKDWLDDLKLEVPQTIDEWYTVLKAFKEKKGAIAPLSYLEANNMLINGGFVGAYGMIKTFYMDKGIIKYGPMEAGYKAFLTTFKKWFDEGLLDKDFATISSQTQIANITNGKTGAIIHNTGGGIGVMLTTMASKDPNYNVVGARYPVLKKGDKPKFGQMDFSVPGTDIAVVNAKSKNIEVAVKLLDYGYSDEGHMVMNFGEDGVSYNMVNGYPKYTDAILKNPKGYTVAEALGNYFNGTANPTVQDKRYFEQYLTFPQQIKAVQTWSNTDAAKHFVPNIVQTSEEAQQISKIMADVNTYEKEMYLKFIMGVEPLNNFDKYVDQLKKLGVEKVIALKQSALESYNK